MTSPRVRTLLRPALALGGVGVLVLGLPGISSALSTGGDLAGYVADSGTYTSVTASWTQPTVRCGSADTYLGIWVGIDGYGDDTVEQAGTEADCDDDSAYYAAWFELYPASPVTYSETVDPGDSMTATVSTDSDDVFTIKISDNTQQWTETTERTDSSAERASAEVFVENPDGVSVVGDSVKFTNAEVNGEALSAVDPTDISSEFTTCGPLDDGGAFTCTLS